MNIKLFGLVWNLKPILVFFWMVLAVVLCIGMLVAFGEDRVGLGLVFCAASVLWSYITSTLAENGVL